MLIGTNYATLSSEAWVAKVTFSLVWAGKHAIVEGIAFLLMQKGLGITIIIKSNKNMNNNNNNKEIMLQKWLD